ncbi:GNAT family N-acetyltransferase [Paenibacillus sp. J2TS4]|uniref:GNAT family N-acetyltransferase n=1 Tax=Paenibacillus sp. J2TS4 TaxID=2807194 RepID=UPI001B11B4E7|nr:GNAT family N-acetyltransferase [Paenibacillus sp. J2TS4]GIP34140.1 N-acetyltransferase [Paenibacillus sp. J2TS4]
MIRPAQKNDVQEAVPLIHSAIGRIANTIAGTSDLEEALDVLGQFYQQEGNRYSYENIIVKELDGKAVGLLTAYHGSLSEQLDLPYMERLRALNGDSPVSLKKEAKEDEYYLDSLAVNPAYQGKGIGTELIQAFEQNGREKGFEKLSLLCDINNPNAARLYERLGYRPDGALTVSGYHFIRMVKPIQLEEAHIKQ